MIKNTCPIQKGCGFKNFGGCGFKSFGGYFHDNTHKFSGFEIPCSKFFQYQQKHLYMYLCLRLCACVPVCECACILYICRCLSMCTLNYIHIAAKYLLKANRYFLQQENIMIDSEILVSRLKKRGRSRNFEVTLTHFHVGKCFY